MVLAELTVLAPGGVEEVAGDGYVEYAIYGAEGELPDLGEVRAASGDGLVEVVSSEVADDWSERWRAFHKPLRVGDPDEGRSIWLRPPWEPAREGELEVVVDPGQAFGTGAHPTTRLCVEALIREADTGRSGPLTDLGCGSGVLAIAAARLGFGPLEGCDHEAAAVEAARENATVNGIEAEFTRADLRDGLPSLAPLTVANLTAPILLEVAARMTPDNVPQTLICSGLLNTEYERVADGFAPFGLVEVFRDRMGEWGSLVLEKQGG